jgi:hypothetical protein
MVNQKVYKFLAKAFETGRYEAASVDTKNTKRRE